MLMENSNLFETDGKGSIIKYHGIGISDLVIPNKINGEDILGISFSVFSSDPSLKSIVISDGIKYIAENAFMNCFKLSEITIPKSIKCIGKDAFLNCNLKVVNYHGTMEQWNTLIGIKPFKESKLNIIKSQEPSSLTRKQLCEYILRNHCVSILGMDMFKIDLKSIDQELALKNTIVGICMDELGLIDDPEIKYYIHNRGGVLFSTFDDNGEVVIVTLKDILNSFKK